jgi:hypothetical protein
MDQTTISKCKVLSDYPSVDNVHFPFQRPYEVQRALMETLLEALRPNCQDITRIGASGKSLLSSGGDQRRKAKVIFLESPTGTGKSLSLGKNSLKTVIPGFSFS